MSRPMPRRRQVLQAAAAGALAAAAPHWAAHAAEPSILQPRVRPGDAGWPGEADWQALQAQLGDRLITPASPLLACRATPASAECAALFKSLKNPYFISDHPALTQTLGWVDAWTSMPSARAVAARSTADVVAAVDFARRHRLRLVIKGGGHSYHGGSNAADSLLVWTRGMRNVTVHEAFVADGCSGTAPQRAVTLGAGALWSDAYHAVTTQAGGYVQGGGCMTVGVAGLVQSGGFGSFSKRFGLAAASLLQAEVVTADGQVRIANACTNPELFWALKGGGGSSLGVVTQLTLRVHSLPENFGAANMTVRATSPEAFRRLVALVIDFYADHLMNPHWGEQIRLLPDRRLVVSMVFQGLDRAEAQAAWAPFIEALSRDAQDYVLESAPFIMAVSARTFWAPTLPKRLLGFMARDDRPDTPETNVFWPGDQGQAGQMLHGYQSTWLPAGLLQPAHRAALCDALYAASRHTGISLHMNKGLAGAPREVIAAARDTAINPAVLDAFALVIAGAGEQPAYPGIAGHTPHAETGRARAHAVARARNLLRAVVPQAGSYFSESDYFEDDWQRAHWGSNYARLAAAKQQFDPEGLFFVHHGVGSERWSADGFTPKAG